MPELAWMCPLAALLLASAAVLGGFAWRAARAHAAFKARAVRVMGRVVELVPDEVGDSHLLRARVAYELGGATCHVDDDVASSPPRRRVGEPVEVLHARDGARVADARPWGAIVLGSLGLLFGVLGLSVLAMAALFVAVGR